MTQIAVTVNGMRREADVEPRTLLVYFLREPYLPADSCPGRASGR